MGCLSIILGVLFFPFAVILSLAKRYKYPCFTKNARLP